MSEARISVLVLARDEAANLPGCLDSVAWADEVVVIVDRASRDQTLAIAQRVADVVAVRPFDDFASQRNAETASIQIALGASSQSRSPVSRSSKRPNSYDADNRGVNARVDKCLTAGLRAPYG